MRTADTARSDPDLAGLMVRCSDKQSLEVTLALVRPVPPRSKRSVLISWGTTQAAFQAEASSTGAALGLPAEVTSLARDIWQRAAELAVTIKDTDGEIKGVILLDGLAPAMARLSANCPN